LRPAERIAAVSMLTPPIGNTVIAKELAAWNENVRFL
jgi:hypothetical protein